MQTATVSKWGNAQAIRLPSDYCKKLGISAGDTVSIEIAKGKLVVSATKPKLPNTIHERIKFWDGVRDKSRETDWGADVGKEVWWGDEARKTRFSNRGIWYGWSLALRSGMNQTRQIVF